MPSTLANAPSQVALQNPNLTPEELVVQEAKDRFQEADDHWRPFLKVAEDCLKYVSGDDYLGDTYKANRESAGLPCLTENRVQGTVDHNVNEFKANIPAIQIDADTGTDPKFADQISDVIRTIEVDSNYKVQYGQAGWYSLATGLGFIRVRSEYVSDDAFEQKLVLEAIEDPSTVRMDPYHRSPVGADQEYCFIVKDLTHDEYLMKYPNSKMAADLESMVNDNNVPAASWSGAPNNQQDGWLTSKLVRVCEYYKKEWYTETLYQYRDPATGALKTTTETRKDYLNSRPVERFKVMYYVVNDKEVLNRDDETGELGQFWPGKRIPIVPFKGTEFWNQSKRELYGLVKSLRDPQKRLDYAVNWMSEMLMMAPKAKYIGTAKNFENYEQQWADSNLSNQPFLPYNPDPTNGNAPPQRQAYEPPVQSAQIMYENAKSAIQEVAGMITGADQQPAEGAPESGRAFLARLGNSQMTRLSDQENIRNSIAEVGRNLVECFPYFYEENGRQVLGTKKDGTQYELELNSSLDNMVESAKFKVVVEAGAAYATKRQEAADKAMALIGVYPESAPLIADIAVRNMDWPGAKEISQRLQTAVPPAALAATEASNPQEGPQVIANLKAQLASATQKLQQLQQEIQPDKIKLQKAEMEAAFSKNDKTWETEKVKHEFEVEKMKLKLEEQKTILEAEIKRKELELEERQIAIQEAELRMKIELAKSTIADKVMGHHHKVHEALTIPDTSSETITDEAKTGPEGDDNDLDIKE